jgi:hypothetical protein
MYKLKYRDTNNGINRAVFSDLIEMNIFLLINQITIFIAVKIKGIDNEK